MAGLLVSIIFSFAALQSFASAMNVPPFANSLEADICLQRDAIYKPGDRFANEACTGWCTCGVRGHVACVSLCPPSPIPMCPPGKLPEIQERPSADPTGRCTCKRKSCFPAPRLAQPPPDICLIGGAIYKPGEKFANEACTGWCTCFSGGHLGCVSLCPLVHMAPCPPGFVLETQEKPSADPTGKCTCKRKTCVPRLPLPPPGGLLKHHVVPECRERVPNEWFINKSCTGRCKCEMGGIACVSLCPPMGVSCRPEEERESYEHSIDGRCTCKRERCVAKIGA